MVSKRRSIAMVDMTSLLPFSLEFKVGIVEELSPRLIISTKHVMTLPCFSVSGYTQRINQLANCTLK
jgi:hypothetical protein